MVFEIADTALVEAIADHVVPSATNAGSVLAAEVTKAL
jgi:hypothetical protein